MPVCSFFAFLLTFSLFIELKGHQASFASVGVPFVI